MTYLLTGATGFIGRSLVERLLNEGHAVHYLGRRRSGELDSRAAFHLWEDLALAPPLDSVPPVDAIIHLAGEPIAQRWTPEVKSRISSSRLEGTRNLVDAIGWMKKRPRVLVAGSAIGYYGDRGDEILQEDSVPGSGFLADLCREWENEAKRVAQFGVRSVCVRTGIVLGNGGGALAKMLPPFRWGVGGRFGAGRQWMSWIHRDDLLSLLQFAAETEAVSGVLNGTAPAPVTNAEFTRVLARALHRPALFTVPRFLLRLIMGEMADFLLDSERVLPAAALQHGFRFRFESLPEALAQILGGRA